MPAMQRSDFQELARLRIRESRRLLRAREYSGCYHLAGISVECALKAVICTRTRRHQFPVKDTRDYYCHDLSKLLGLSQLNLQAEAAADPVFGSGSV